MHISLLKKQKLSSWMPVLKVLIVAVPIIVMCTLINDNYFFTKTLHFTYRPGSSTHAIQPKDATQIVRTADVAIRWKIFPEAFPFLVTIPRLIDAVTVSATLNPGTQPSVYLRAFGAQKTDVSTIAYSKVLNDLQWPVVTKNGISIWQRSATYDSVDAFQAHPPESSKIATVAIDRMSFAGPQHITSNDTPITLPQTFRGHHQLYAYVPNSTLHVSLEKNDLNRTAGADTLTIRIAKASTLTSGTIHWIASVNTPDDGNTGASGPKGKSQQVDVRADGLTQGVYLVDIFTGGDVIFSNLSSNVRGLSFSGSIWLAEGPAYAQSDFVPATFSTNGTLVTLAAQHDQGKQSITINGKKFSIDDVKNNHQVSSLTGVTTFTVPKGDMIITSDGLTSIQPAALLANGTKELDISADLNLEGIDYIVAEYVPQHGKDIRITHTYQLHDLALAGKTLTFFLDSPEMQKNSTTLGLQELSVTMTRGSFPWNKIWKKIGLAK